MIKIEDFIKIELKVGTILEAEEVEGAEKLIKLKVDLGPLDVIPAKAGIHLNTSSSELDPALRRDDRNGDNKRDIRQILAGIKQWYQPEKLIGKQVVVVANLEPRIMMGLESQGMLLAASPVPNGTGADSGKAVILKPSAKVPPGTKVR